MNRATTGRRHWEHRATVCHGSPLGGKVNPESLLAQRSRMITNSALGVVHGAMVTKSFLVAEPTPVIVDHRFARLRWIVWNSTADRVKLHLGRFGWPGLRLVPFALSANWPSWSTSSNARCSWSGAIASWHSKQSKPESPPPRRAYFPLLLITSRGRPLRSPPSADGHTLFQLIRLAAIQALAEFGGQMTSTSSFCWLA